MKKVRLVVFAMLLIAAQSVYAQNDYTAYTLSNTTFQGGTARSVAMGNAVSALGGDLGAINFNPAGVAVYKFTEVGITPSLTTVSTTSDLFGTSHKSTRSNFGLANTGAVFYIPLSRGSGIKNINFGITFTKLSDYSSTEVAKHNGNVSDPTYLDHLAKYTTRTGNALGYKADVFSSMLDKNDVQNPYAHFGGALWSSILGWNTSLLNLNAAGDTFIPTEQHEIDQSFRRKSFGYNSATDLSLGFNFGDMVYLGTNLTLNSVYNRIEQKYSEDGVGVQDFNYMDQIYEQKTAGTGVGGKIGIIVTPTPFIRFGAAISTPTIYYLTDRAHWKMNSSLGTDYNVTLKTPRLEMDYRLVTPFKYNLGVSVVLPVAALSLDYEGTNYSQMRFLSADSGPDQDYDWEEMNDIIKANYTTQSKIRAGVEINPTQTLSLRAGIQYSNSGIKNLDLDTYVGSLGAGYSSPNGFFADLGFSTTLKKTDVLFDGTDLVSEYIASNASSAYKRGNWKLLLTVGFRF